MTENKYISRTTRKNMMSQLLLEEAAEALTRDADLGLVAGSHAIHALGAMTRLGYRHHTQSFPLAMAGAVDQAGGLLRARASTDVKSKNQIRASL